MSTFYVHIQTPIGLVQDNEGFEAPSLAAVRKDTIEAIRDLVAADVLEGNVDLHGSAMICDEAGLPLAVLSYRDAVCIRGG